MSTEKLIEAIASQVSYIQANYNKFPLCSESKEFIRTLEQRTIRAANDPEALQAHLQRMLAIRGELLEIERDIYLGKILPPPPDVTH